MLLDVIHSFFKMAGEGQKILMGLEGTDVSYAVQLSFFLRAAPMTYGGSQARGLIGAAAAGLCQSHSNAGSEPSLQPIPQLMATPDPSATEQGQGSNRIRSLMVPSQMR